VVEGGVMRRYPEKIGWLFKALDTPKQRKLLRRSLAIGEIETAEADTDLLPELEFLCSKAGYRFNTKNRIHYALNDCVFGAGSIGPHNDMGMGLTAIALLAVADLSKNFTADKFRGDWSNGDCVLFTGGTYLHIKVGEVVVFDANQEHAWMSNSRWLLLSQSVRRVRGRAA
jgi:hypothetical protein